MSEYVTGVRNLDVLRMYNAGDCRVLGSLLVPVNADNDEYVMVVYYEYMRGCVVVIKCDSYGFSDFMVEAPEGMDDEDVYDSTEVTVYDEATLSIVRDEFVSGVEDFLRIVKEVRSEA
jgi:hypothetical protein